jgi:hypothetical protein
MKSKQVVKKPKEKSEKKVKEILLSFLRNIRSVQIFFNRLSPLAETEDKAIEQERHDYYDTCLKAAFGEDYKNKKTNKKGEKPSFTLSDDELKKLVHKIAKAPNIPAKNYETLARGAFIMLNNYFEYLFSDLLTYHFKKNRSAIESKKVNISLEELKKYNSIEEAYDDFLYKEVETLLLDLNFEELKSYFKDKLNISLEEHLIDWNFINEIRERRHIIVHNNSIVNKKYLSRSLNPFNLKLGDEVNIDVSYFKKVIDEIKIAGLLLALNCWGSWDKEDATDAISFIMDNTFSELQEQNFEIPVKLASYCEKNIKPRNDEEDDYCYRIKFNHCISLKRLGHKDELTKKLASIKPGTLSPIFKIAHYALRDKFEEVIDLIPKAIIADDFNIDKYLDWPLFNEMRHNESVHKRALETFKK